MPAIMPFEKSVDSGLRIVSSGTNRPAVSSAMGFRYSYQSFLMMLRANRSNKDFLQLKFGIFIEERRGRRVLHDAAFVQHENTVGDLVEIVGNVGGQHDRDILFASELPQEIENVEAYEWIEARRRLIQDEERGPMANGGNKSELDAIAFR